MRQACIEGYLDHADANILDRTWMAKAKMTLDWLEHKNRVEVSKLQHELNCSLLSYAAGDRAVDLHWHQAVELQNSVRKAILPWVPEEEAKVMRKTVYDMVDTWKKIYGDPNDPTVSAKIDATVAELMKQAAKTTSPGVNDAPARRPKKTVHKGRRFLQSYGERRQQIREVGKRPVQ